MVERLQAELDLKEEIDWSQFDIDSTSVWASRAAFLPPRLSSRSWTQYGCRSRSDAPESGRMR